jgi:hypothetical protein
MNIRRKGLGIARREIVEPADLVTLPGKSVGEGRAEKTRGSGDQKVHRFKIISETVRYVSFN